MGRIDVHHHILPTEYVQKWKEVLGIPKGLKLPSWSVELDLQFMDRNNIDVSILSLSAPGLAFVKSADEASKLCRWVNDYAAEIVTRHPLRFGFFASLPPLNQIDACLEEVRYSLDVLKADGIALLSSYEDKYLGHEDFQPLWKELHRRNAVVFIHPTFAKTWGAPSDLTIPRPIIDFPHETTRTAVSLITSNIIHDFTNCKIILSHGGGTLPYMATRIAHQTADLGLKDKSADEFIREAKSFYYDLALTGYESPVKLLRDFADADHILYGSDFPFAREGTIVPQIANINAAPIEDNERQSIESGAASKLFPRLNR
ncbi:amidohydrolase family protein [Didymella exigua CBS 183.55]|uniref:6-methylsalicylate decarboxylase n=1 Tax=Didymella exigua CBS 183.55 TaxID=1150837 RepID=A0A6A5R5J5_9PLEO|nr:amidohydrolase family protein [Didymella exigua CBS 183.55]KAF1923395.1 amidohydrolase family protein [Didymella exigua CBS 183.55]